MHDNSIAHLFIRRNSVGAHAITGWCTIAEPGVKESVVGVTTTAHKRRNNVCAPIFGDLLVAKKSGRGHRSNFTITAAR